jgi:hypothetical protein
MAAYGKGARRITRSHAAMAIHDTEETRGQGSASRPALQIGLALGAVASASAGLYYFLRTVP